MTTAKKPAAKKAIAKKAPAKRAASKKSEEDLIAEALTPDESVFEMYYPRSFPGWIEEDGTVVEFEDLDMLQFADEENQNVLMFGPTGPGKTTAVMAYAAKVQKPVVTISCNGGVDPNTFWGQPVREKDGSFTFSWSTVLLGIANGWIINLDEINFLLPRIGAVFHPALDGRRIIVVPDLGNKVIPVHPDTFFVASYNPGYQGTRPLNEAFKNRFPMKWHYGYDREIEAHVVPIADGTNVEPLLDLADRLRKMYEDGTIITPVSTNMLREFLNVSSRTSYDFGTWNFTNAFEEDERQAVRNNFDLLETQLRELVDQTKAAAGI